MGAQSTSGTIAPSHEIGLNASAESAAKAHPAVAVPTAGEAGARAEVGAGAGASAGRSLGLADTSAIGGPVAVDGAAPVAGAGPAVAVGVGAVPVVVDTATRQKEKRSRTFNQLALVVMLFSRAWESGAAEWQPKLEEAAGERPTSAARLLLNLFLHIIPCLAEWFKVLKYSSEPEVVMRMLTDMTAVCWMVGCTHYVVALAQLIAQLQELKRKAPNLWEVVMRNFHAFNGLFIEDQHAHLTRLLEGAHRFITGRMVNDELRLLEYHASAKEFLKQFDTSQERTAWSLPTAGDRRYTPAVDHCKILLDTAVSRACIDGEQSTLESVIIQRLYFDLVAINRVVEKVRERDTDQYVAEREHHVSEYPGDKMVWISLVSDEPRSDRIFNHDCLSRSSFSPAITCACTDCQRLCGGHSRQCPRKNSAASIVGC